MKKPHFLFLDRYVLVMISISLVVALLIHFPEIISLFYLDEMVELFPGLRLNQVVCEVCFTFLSLLILFAINIRLFCFHQTSGRVGVGRVLVSFVVTWLLSNLMAKGFVFLHHHLGIPAIEAMLHHYLHPLRDFIITCIVSGSCYIICLIRQKQQMLLENQQLRTENLVNQFEVLKNQLNPHMLFNSLNTLQSLVRETPEKAGEYICQLSRVLRFTLQDQDRRVISLTGEMNFVNAYLYLQKMRYEDNLEFSIELEEKTDSLFLPPMSVQILVENAIRHNEISNRKPLHIRIAIERNEWLCVSNDLQPKRTDNPGTGIGLANLSKRYELLFHREIVVRNDGACFSVCIPLMKEPI